jgi:hypothetical protein
MILDALLNFIPIGSPLTVTSAAIASPNVIDLLGLGAGVNPTSASIIGNVTLFGAPDAMGVGGPRPELNVTLGTSNWAGGTSLNVALQGAPDAGTPTFQPGTFTTYAETGLILTASLLANTVIARFPWLPPFPANQRPRFLRLLFTPAGTFTTGQVASALVTLVRDDQFNKYAANNYKVA